MKEELTCVDSGVGSPAAVNGDRFFENSANAIFERLLHALLSRLSLPTEIFRTLIGYVNEVSQFAKLRIVFQI